MINTELKKLKKIIIQLSMNSKEGHIASAFSILDILYILYDEILNYSKKNTDKEINDTFILSKGHASLALYVILYKNSFFTKKELNTFCKYSSPFGGHPDRNKIPGVVASTGSLGHGLPIAVGIAMANKIQNNKSKTFVLIGDGELNEGTNWEAILLATHHNLCNLICIIDHNRSTNRALMIDNVKDKFSSFGWIVKEIDGHDHIQIKQAFLKKSSLKPLAIIANTIKGKGIKRMENKPEWHHKFPNKEEYIELLAELKIK